MSSYKILNTSDIYQDKLVSNKSWVFTYYSSSYDNNIQYYVGKCTSSLYTSGSNEQLEYDKINQLFYHKYSNINLNIKHDDRIKSQYYLSASNHRNTSSYFNYNENPLFDSSTFPINDNQTIKSIYINKSVYGNQILPGSFIISSSDYYILDDGYGNLQDWKFALSGAFYVSSSYVDYNYIKEYNSGSGIPVGNIFYSFGLAVITEQIYQNQFPMPLTDTTMSFSFKNEWNVYENYIYCKIKAGQFNLSYNPTLLKNNGSEGEMLDFVTSSFSPYATSVGLYNDNNELLAVAKLGQPLYISQEIDTNILIKYDT